METITTATRRIHPLMAAAAASVIVVSLVGTAVAGSLPQIVSSVVTGVQSVREWIAGPPLNLADSQLTALVQQVTTRIQESVSTIAAKSSGVPNRAVGA